MTDTTDRRTLLRTIGATGAAVATVSLAGCSADGSSDTDSPTATDSPTEASGDEGFEQTDAVDMTDDLTFEPKQIQVEAGTTVTWTTVGGVGHTVTAYEDEIPDGATYFASGGFESEAAAKEGYPDEGNVPEGASFEHTFETTGTYEYYCIPHEMNGMVGTVEVV